ncbi:MAG: hypothetical protein ACSI46_29740 [Gloeotrichia echinulata DVL01]|jgi:hypothetical protein
MDIYRQLLAVYKICNLRKLEKSEEINSTNVDDLRNRYLGNYASWIPTMQAPLAVYSITSTTIQ